MRKVYSMLWILTLSVLLMWCENKSDKDFDLSTPEWRLEHCLWWVEDKLGTDSYTVSWDDEGEDYWLIILDWLLESDDWYYDVECTHEKDGTWFSVNLFPVEEVMYLQPEGM